MDKFKSDKIKNIYQPLGVAHHSIFRRDPQTHPPFSITSLSKCVPLCEFAPPKGGVFKRY